MQRSLPEIIGALICLTLGLLSGYISNAGPMEWYSLLNKPHWNPPSWLFGPVWTVLYLMMGGIVGHLSKDPQKNRLLILLFGVQMLLNLVWSPLFFYFHRIDLALMDLVLLWLMVTLFAIQLRQHKVLSLLWSPYVLWVSFAMVLNAEIYRLNS